MTLLVQLNRGFVARVSDVDGWVRGFIWSVCDRGHKHYAARWERRDGKRVKLYLHREVYRMATGREPPPGYVVEHRSNHGLDCRRSNLRLATRAQNAANYPTRGHYRGVCLDRGRWKMRLRVGGEVVAQSMHPCPTAAAIAYDRAALAAFGPFAHTNILPREPDDPEDGLEEIPF